MLFDKQSTLLVLDIKYTFYIVVQKIISQDTKNLVKNVSKFFVQYINTTKINYRNLV